MTTRQTQIAKALSKTRASALRHRYTHLNEILEPVLRISPFFRQIIENHSAEYQNNRTFQCRGQQKLPVSLVIITTQLLPKAGVKFRCCIIPMAVATAIPIVQGEKPKDAE